MRFAMKSDKGKVREINEDSSTMLAGYPGIPAAFIIADGMGGHNAGEIASKMAVDLVSSYIREFPEDRMKEEALPAALEEAIQKANSAIYAESMEHEVNFGMGTTLIAAVALDGTMVIGHIGDSRVYLIRDGRIEQITTDHSYIEELVKNGSLTREEAERHPRRNLITRALGCSALIDIDIYNCTIYEGDYYVLCTDGLSNMLDEEEIKKIILGCGDPGPACEELVRMANERGGEDNITVIVIKNDDCTGGIYGRSDPG